jgi:hypothetical protein
VELLADGQPVSEDRHTGFTGSHPKDAAYQLRIPPEAKSPLTLRITAAGSGGNDSQGAVSITSKR